jgi:hypothetical protein
MNIQSEKLNLIEWISKLEDSDIVLMLRQIKNNFTGEGDSDIELSKEEIESIERGMNDFEEGRVHTDESARKIYEKYL